jgi:pantothenate kinase type III
MNIITVDIGNSATKIALGPQMPLQRVDLSDLESLTFAAGCQHWAIVSVAPPRTKSLRDWLAKNRPDDKVTFITNDDIPIKSSVKNRAGVGTDRLLTAHAAAQSTQQTDYVNDRGTFCGGLIFPGVSTSLRSLSANTAALPDLANDTTQPVTHDIRVGDDTASAILYGVAQSQAWAIVTIAENLAKQHNARVFVTGGDAHLIKNIMPVYWQHVPNLIHDGCRQLF